MIVQQLHENNPGTWALVAECCKLPRCKYKRYQISKFGQMLMILPLEYGTSHFIDLQKDFRVGLTGS